MHHSSFSLALLIACGLATPLQAATPSTITFDGEVTDQTCTATIDGQTDAVVMLPTVSQGDFDGIDTTAGQTTFTLNLSGCSTVASDTKEVKVKFFTSAVSKKNLENTASNGARGVAVQLLDGTQAIDFSTTPVLANVGYLSGTDPTASKEFTAQYISQTDIVGTGKVTATVEYTLSYL